MKYSKMFGKTVKDDQRDLTTISHKLLYKAGYIRESVAGRYYYLPLGIIVRKKIMTIIKEEMDKAGAQELLVPTLHPLELWTETNRVNASNFELMTIKDRKGSEFALGGTAEEMIVDLVRKFQISYKDLPFNIYEFSTKFRDEIRAKGGLIRAREFTMKDGYSFHASKEDFEKEYQNMWNTYSKIFTRLGLETTPVPADNGYFGGDYCHEFNVICNAGESKFFESEDGKYVAHENIATFKHEYKNPDEEIQDMIIIDQPKWVCTMEDNIKFYKEPLWRYLKNVVYRNRITNEIIIVTIRGDLEVNKNKLEKVLNAIGVLDDATDEDLEAIGTKHGYVHCWGGINIQDHLPVGRHGSSQIKVENLRQNQLNPTLVEGSYVTPTGIIWVGDESLKYVKNFIGGQKEDTTDTRNVNYGKDFEHPITADVAKAQEGFLAPDGNSILHTKLGLEVGNIFQLGQHYSNHMRNSVFTDKDGKSQKFYMGCYGIGVERTLAAIVEMHHDDNGIIWPENVAPYKVHLISLGDETTLESAENAYNQLSAARIEVLWDDRDNSTAGEKFKDADLIGCPYRMIISNKSIAAGGVELVKRNDKTKSEIFTLEEAIKKLKSLIT